jgi:hypothetical protein
LLMLPPRLMAGPSPSDPMNIYLWSMCRKHLFASVLWKVSNSGNRPSMAKFFFYRKSSATSVTEVILILSYLNMKTKLSTVPTKASFLSIIGKADKNEPKICPVVVSIRIKQ